MDNQAKWRKLGYKGGDANPASGQALKKSTPVVATAAEGAAASSNDLSVVKRVSEVRRTSDSDITSSRIVTEKSVASLSTRQPEPNGVRKDLVNQEKRRRLSLVDEKDLHLPGDYTMSCCPITMAIINDV